MSPMHVPFAGSPSPAGSQGASEVLLKLVPAPQKPAEGSDPVLKTPRRNWPGPVLEFLSSAGEWMGLTGPKASWMSRLTFAAVSLVLVSGISLVLAPPEPDATAANPVELETDSEVAASHSSRTRSGRTGQELEAATAILQTQAASAEGPTVDPAEFQSASPCTQPAWLDGTIELEE